MHSWIISQVWRIESPKKILDKDELIKNIISSIVTHHVVQKLTFPFCRTIYFQHLRQAGIAGKFVEFFGPGVSQLSAPDRTTIANMCPEYNATASFFPVDQVTLKHFKKTSEWAESETVY